MSDTVQEIKNKLDIAEVVKAYVPLTPAGKNLKGLCPFHHEKSPSFMVSPDRQMWHCFGCGVGGDLFKFVMMFENIEFFEALKFLAEKAGVEISQATAAQGEAYKQLYEINRLAKDFYCHNLHENASAFQAAAADLSRQSGAAFQAAAAEYLKKRGLNVATVKDFEIGLAPTASDALLRFLVGQKKSLADIEKAGLVFRSERGTYWDRFRGRLMFPLYNHLGKIVGFTGRVLPEAAGLANIEAAKYVNSPETPIFSKSKVLYGFHLAKNYIRDAKVAVVVEGQMDFLMSWQDGLKNVVASSGTALTLDHLTTLRRLAENLVLSFDSDEAGVAAAERSIDLANSLDFNVKLLEIKDGFKDPADVVLASPGRMREFVAAAKPAMQYYFDRYLGTGGGSSDDWPARKKNLRLILTKIKSVASSIERERYMQELSRVSGVGEPALLEEMENLKNSEAVSSNIKISSAPVIAPEAEGRLPRTALVAERILGVLLSNPSLSDEVAPYKEKMPAVYQTLMANLGPRGFSALPMEAQALADKVCLRSDFGSMGLPPSPRLRRAGTAGGLMESPSGLSVAGSPGGCSASDAADDSRRELRQLLRELQLLHYKERLAAARLAIAQAEKIGDETQLAVKLKEFDSLSREMHNLT